MAMTQELMDVCPKRCFCELRCGITSMNVLVGILHSLTGTMAISEQTVCSQAPGADIPWSYKK
eukprot:5379655-Amphidinium_carterae.1